MGSKVKGLYGTAMDLPEHADYRGPQAEMPPPAAQPRPDDRVVALLTEIRNDTRGSRATLRGIAAIMVFFFVVGIVVIIG